MSGLDTTQYESSATQGFYAYTETLKGVYYGPGSIKTAIPQLLETLGAKKALIVTGRSLHEKVRHDKHYSTSVRPPLTYLPDGCCSQSRGGSQREERLWRDVLRDRPTLTGCRHPLWCQGLRSYRLRHYRLSRRWLTSRCLEDDHLPPEAGAWRKLSLDQANSRSDNPECRRVHDRSWLHERRRCEGRRQLAGAGTFGRDSGCRAHFVYTCEPLVRVVVFFSLS